MVKCYVVDVHITPLEEKTTYNISKIPNEYQIHMTIINMTYPMSSGTKVTTHKT